jgi:hypothetical protein
VASAALTIAGVISAGGIHTLFVKKFAAKIVAKIRARNLSQNPNPKEETWAK